MKFLLIVFLGLVTISCYNDEVIDTDRVLASYIKNKTVEVGAVISCAASDAITNEVLVFYYPIPNAKNIRFYETINSEVDKNDFTAYQRIDIVEQPFFNGYLEVFKKNFKQENWVIITYEFGNEIKLSNPIRIKHQTKHTVWNDVVEIDQNESTMPKFTWIDNENEGNAIYFQVISDDNNDLLSGTYTYENNFQYYNTSNVVLNITTQTPPDLIIDATYNFTLMDVSLDNWVNTVIEKSFIVK